MKTAFLFVAAVSLLLYGCQYSSATNRELLENQTTVALLSATSPAKSSVGEAADAATILLRRQVPVLCYHQVRDYKPADSKTARAYIVPVNIFREQMQTLADSGYHAVLPAQVYDYLVYGKSLPEKPVLITFDDTRLDQYTAALPILEQLRYKAAFYIMTVSLGRPGYMSREQVADLHRRGHSIGSHTWDHQNVKKYAEKDWVTQIEKPSNQLASIIGEPIEYFAYPFGLWNEPAIPELKKKGIKMAFQLADKADANDPLHTVRRIIVPGSMSGQSLLKAMRNSF